MVRLLNPVGSGGASGSMGGTTFARNHYGSYARNRTSPINKNTPLQNKVRNAMRDLAMRWRATLTDAYRAGWELYGQNVPMIGKFGDVIHLPGKEHYIRSNTIRLYAGDAMVDIPPTTFAIPAAALNVTVSYSAATQKASVAFDNSEAWANENGGALYILQGRPQNPVRKFYGGPWNLMGEVAGQPVPKTSPQLYDVKFPVAASQICWLQLRVARADGRLSTPFLVHGTVSA
jgi:hypothetical protein